MESSQITDVVKILIKDEHLLKDWSKLHNSLGLCQDGDYVLLMNQNKLGNITDKDLFSEILTRWSLISGQKATLKNLTETLESLYFKSTAENLQKAFQTVTPSTSTIFSNTDDATWNTASVNMEFTQITEAVKILIKDEHLIANWTALKNVLGLGGNADCIGLRNQYKIGIITEYDLFLKLLTIWKAVNGREATVGKLSEALESLNFKSTAEKLQTYFKIATASYPTTFFKIKDATWNFVGRSKEIEELTKWFRREHRPILKVIGMGGIGKSELVMKFASTLKNEVNGIWLNGDSSESLNNSIVRVAKKLRVSTTTDNNQPKSSVKMLSEIIAAIKNKNDLRVLVIIDNVDAENADVHLILKKVIKLRSFALITSRNSRVVADAGETLNLDILDTQDSQQFVRDSLDGESEEDVSHLCLLLNNYPLALQQAVAFITTQKEGIQGQSFRIPDYLKIYEKNKVKLLAFPLNSIEHEYRLTTLVTWNTSTEQIQKNGETGALAIELLNFISYFDANGIDFEFLKTIDRGRISNEKERDDDIYEEAIFLLKEYSLLKCENKLISIHRLVQEVTRVNCISSNLEEPLLRQLVQSIATIRNKLKQRDMPHVLSVSKAVLNHDEIVRDFSTFPFKMIIRLCELSLYVEMLDFASLSYRRLSRILGEKHSETLRVKSEAADALRYNGNFEEALQKFIVVHEEQRSAFGEEDPTTLATGHNLACLLHRLDRYDEALETFKRVLKSRINMLGESHEETIRTKGSMASVLSFQGKYREAMELHEEVLEWRKTELGEGDPDTLGTRHNIGVCLYRQNEFIKARGIFEEVLELTLKVLGEEHSDTLTTKFMLACTLVSLGESEEGLRMLEEVLVSREKVLGSQHPDTISTREKIDFIVAGRSS